MKSSAWLLRRRAPSKRAEEVTSSREEVVRIGITTRIETAVNVKTATTRYKFKAKVNRFTTLTKQDKMKPMMDVATLIPNQRSATRTRIEIGTAAITNETTKDRMLLVAMELMGVADEEMVAVDKAVARIN